VSTASRPRPRRNAQRKASYAMVLALFASLTVSALSAAPATASGSRTIATAIEPATTYLQLDNETSLSYADRWQTGDRICVIYRPPDILFPLTIDSLICNLTTFTGSTITATLRAQVFSVAVGGPSNLLASGPPSDIEVGATAWVQRWAELGFGQKVTIREPQAIGLAIEYLGGAAGSTPSLVIDSSAHIPHDRIFYQSAGAEWREHYDYAWIEPESIGYPMIRAWTSTFDATTVEAEANAMLSSGQPDTIVEVGSYLVVGDLSPGWGNLRSLVRFPVPEAPYSEARPVDAAMRLWRYNEVTHTLPFTMEVCMATADWQESTATWSTIADRHSASVSTAIVPGQPAGEAPADHHLYASVLGPAAEWITGEEPNRGFMLIGGEDLGFTPKRFRSRSCSLAHQRPQLIVKWSQLAVATSTPTTTPSPSPTASVPDRSGLYMPLIVKRGP